MKKSTCCPICDTEIEIKDRYIKSDNTRVGFKEPCNTCAYNESDEMKIPCRFCVHI